MPGMGTGVWHNEIAKQSLTVKEHRLLEFRRRGIGQIRVSAILKFFFIAIQLKSSCSEIKQDKSIGLKYLSHYPSMESAEKGLVSKCRQLETPFSYIPLNPTPQNM